MSKTNRLVLWGLGGVLLLCLAWYGQWFFNNYQRQTQSQRVDVSPAAQRNPFLAAERFLQTLGYQAESFRARDLISKLPPPSDALLVRRMQTDLSDEQRERLNTWLEAGGVLIVTPPYFTGDGSNRDDFLSDLGVVMVSGSIDEPVDEIETEMDILHAGQPGSESEAASDGGYQTIRLLFTGEAEPIEASFRRNRYLQDRDHWASQQFGVDGTQYLLFETGLGRVIVLSDLDLFTNERIGLFDHAYLLGQLVGGRHKVWLQYGNDTPALLQLLWQKIPFVIMTLAVLLLCMGWRLFLYTGPPLNLHKEQRRNLLEHIDATADYAWRIDKADSLFEHNRNVIEQAWRKRHPSLNSMDNQQRAQWIGEKTGMAGAAVERSLYQDIAKDQDFIKATLVLQQLASGLKQRELR